MLIVLATAVTACTPLAWVKPGAGPEQFARDSTQCRSEAYQEAFRRTWNLRSLLPPIVRTDAQGRVFVVPQEPDPFHDRFVEEGRLADACMRAKGYELREMEAMK